MAAMYFGLAGALDPALASGDLVVARQVRNDGGDLYPCDTGWQEALHAALAETRMPCRRGAILGSVRLWRQPADKRSQFAATGCLAVDMESGAVAAIASECATTAGALTIAAPAGRLSPLITTCDSTRTCGTVQIGVVAT